MIGIGLGVTGSSGNPLAFRERLFRDSMTLQDSLLMHTGLLYPDTLALSDAKVPVLGYDIPESADTINEFGDVAETDFVGYLAVAEDPDALDLSDATAFLNVALISVGEALNLQDATSGNRQPDF